jgi:hypothetical protein
MASARSEQLQALAQRVADAVPTDIAQEIVLTGSVSRGVADDLSDIEMLIVASQPLSLDECFAMASGAGLDGLGTWGAQEAPVRRVSGRRERVPIELVWWPRTFAESQVELLVSGEAPGSTADALVHGVPLRTIGLLAAWQTRLGAYPPALAAKQIQQATLAWGGFAPAGVLTLIRPGDRLALVEWLLDGSVRVLAIVFAMNGVWHPTTKRLATRVLPLEIKPDRLAERIEEALTEPDARRALRVMTELQLDTVLLAPSGANVERARAWLAAAADQLGLG